MDNTKVKVKRINPNGIKPVYVNDFEVGHAEDMFCLTFSQVDPSRRPEEIESIQMGKFFVTPLLVSRIIKALNENYCKYLAKEKTELLTQNTMGSA